MATPQTFTSPAVARLHRWPAAMAQTLTGTLDFIAHRAAEEVGISAGAGITLLTTAGRRITSSATDSLAEQLNALHDRHPQNPCIAAWSTRSTVHATRGDDALRWPGWVDQAAGLGAHSVLIAPLCTAQRLLGTLLVYSREPGAYRRSDELMLDSYARDAAILIDETQSARAQFFRATRAKR